MCLAREAAVERVAEDATVIVAQRVLTLADVFGGSAGEPEHTLAVGEVGGQSGNRPDLVDAGSGEDEFAVFVAEGGTVGLLVFFVAGREVEHAAAGGGVEREIGVGRFDAGEVVEVVVLADGVEAGNLRRGGEDDEALAEFDEKLATAGGELGGGEIVLERERGFAGKGGHGEREKGAERRGVYFSRIQTMERPPRLLRA
jgi:hypothetical protein